MDDSKSDFDSDIRRQIDLQEPQAQRRYPPKSVSPENIRRGRFGHALLLVAIFSLVGSIQSPNAQIGHVLLFAAIACALCAAYFIDSANARLRKPKSSSR